jgi:hypothetical protein
MKVSFARTSRFGWVVVLLALLVASGTGARADGLKLEASLIWGTNDEPSGNPDVKPVEPKVEKKLKKLPFKWKNYFEVKRTQLTVPRGEAVKVAMSKDCEIQVRNLGDDTVELSLIGKGTQVSKIKQALPKGELLVTGGNAENFTAWFVVLRQIE